VTGTSASDTKTATTAVKVWAHKDVGAVGVAGSTNYLNSTFTISAAGPSIYNTADGMHFAYQPLSGDGSIVARIVNVSGMRSGTSGEPAS